MQPIAFRSSSKRFKRRRVVTNNNDDNGNSLPTRRNARRFGNPPTVQEEEDELDDEDSDDDNVPVRRRIVQGVVQEPEKKRQLAVESEKKADTALGVHLDLEPLPHLQGNGRSQIERLMNRRLTDPLSTDEPNGTEIAPGDDGAMFRKQLAGCAEEVDDDTYATVPVEKFGARMLAAMGWKPEKRDDDDVVEKQRVQWPAGLGLGAKLNGTGAAALPSHRRRDGANGTASNAGASTIESRLAGSSGGNDDK